MRKTDELDSIFQLFRKASRDFNTRYKSSQRREPLMAVPSLTDFERVKTIMKGKYGPIMLAQQQDTDNYYCVAIRFKKKIVKANAIGQLLHEKHILLAIDCPFISKLQYCFKDNSNIYMVKEYVPGGPLQSMMERSSRFSESTSRFYACQMVLALDYLHNLGIIFRNLNPESILVDGQGNLKLNGFSNAKRIDGMAHTMCGKFDYLAPEIILAKPYDHAVDLWALGVLIFEMRAGSRPFVAEKTEDLFQRIVLGKMKYPGHFSAPMQELLEGLLDTDMQQRTTTLGIKAHKWCFDQDWISIYQKQTEAPFIPRVESPGDHNNYSNLDEESFRVHYHEEFPGLFDEF